MSGPAFRIAFVVPRYGREIVGGAETLARLFAERLSRGRFEVEVLTTCALDHHTWRNVLPAGSDEVDGVSVRRFPVSPRDVDTFHQIQARISAGIPVDLDEELAWARGSVNAEGLYDFLAAHAGAYDAILLLPYLFGTTLLGAQIAPERSVLIPCLHDEGFARTRLVEHLFATVRGCLFNSAPERALASQLFGVSPDGPVVGLGFDPQPAAHQASRRFRERAGLDGDYLLYFGRKEGGKNVPLLLDAFARCEGAGRSLSLVIAGDGTIDPSSCSPGVVDLPRLEEDEKRAACAGALALCQPSTNESFSIVLMEAWLQRRPALVHARCPVTREHVRESGGGLYFDGADELAADVAWLRRHPEEADAMGRAGERYVGERYSWPRVLERFEDGLRRTLASSPRHGVDLAT